MRYRSPTATTNCNCLLNENPSNSVQCVGIWSHANLIHPVDNQFPCLIMSAADAAAALPMRIKGFTVLSFGKICPEPAYCQLRTGAGALFHLLFAPGYCIERPFKSVDDPAAASEVYTLRIERGDGVVVKKRNGKMVECAGRPVFEIHRSAGDTDSRFPIRALSAYAAWATLCQLVGDKKPANGLVMYGLHEPVVAARLLQLPGADALLATAARVGPVRHKRAATSARCHPYFCEAQGKAVGDDYIMDPADDLLGDLLMKYIQQL